ncbi:pentatricopeptide repeat-containing protein-like [Dorcoceras hygrometricum]|uniref:Pentatricopeptide repeat-containing protein-like n=1 Tax=Dorcoceras hygrometricum TaxID=472368 RepID=A0A2Z7CYB2_9LAMI|nr:pentatricopeptide repeat-containing protein-like [Dorcoceras hygrometricum]
MLAESIDCSLPPEASNREEETPNPIDTHRARILRIYHDEARLAAQGCTSYEIKASTLRQSDLSSVRDKAGLNELYEVGIPHVRDRSAIILGRISGRENFWGCDMSWRDNAHTSPPSPPEQKPNLTKFLEAMRGKCFNAQQLIEEDLLCFFNFSGKKAQLIGDLGDSMDKATMLEALKERKSKTKSGGASSSGAQNKEETSSGAPSKEKRKASPEKKERCKKHRHEKRDTGSTQESIPEDFDQLKRTPDLEVFESVGLHFMQVRTSSGLRFCTSLTLLTYYICAVLGMVRKAASRFSKARAEVIKTKRSYDGVLGRHEALLKQLEEIQTKENVENESLTAELESARTKAQTLKIQVQSLETQVQSLEARAQLSEEESKLHLAEVEKLQEERANSWTLEKEKFLKSKDFDSLCLKRAVMYFDKGFDGCLAQFRANGYSEEEHPAFFLDVDQALVEMPEDPVEGSSGPGETPPA